MEAIIIHLHVYNLLRTYKTELNVGLCLDDDN